MRKHTLGLAIAGILAPSLSYALGLGEITTNSALNQPLDAEIELVSTTPAEVKNVTVHLAPEAVFDQVGIERTPVLDQLRFTPTVENGVPVIKVTSPGSIQEPFVNFVVEVTWPKGKLLREYTVLLDPPVLSDNAGPPPTPAEQPVFTGPDQQQEQAVAEAETYPVEEGAPVEQVEPIAQPVEEVAKSLPVEETQPVEQAAEPVESFPVEEAAPVAAATPDVGEGLPPFVDNAEEAQAAEPEAVAEVEPVEEAAPVEEAEPVAEAEQPKETYGSLEEAPGTSNIFVSDASQGIVAEAPAGEVMPEAAAAQGSEYRVSRGDTLSGIAARTRPQHINLARMMAALYQSNKSAFAGGNINRLKSGYVLRIPDDSALAAMTTAKARTLLASHGGEAWKKYRKALAKAPAPQEAMDAAKGSVPSIADLAEGKQPSAVEVPGGKVAKGEAPGLEILAPKEGGKTATGTEKGAASDVDAIKEQLASKTQEAAELRSRVEELEGLLAAKERLITLKDEQLAELQKSLAGLKGEAQGEAAPEKAEAGESSAKGGLLPTEGSEKAEEKPAAQETAPAAEETAKPEEAEKPAESEQPPAAKPEPETTTTAETEQPAEQTSVVDEVTKSPNKLLLGGVAGLLALALLTWWGSSRKKRRREETIIDATPAADDELSTVAAEASESEAAPEHEVVDVATEYDNELPDADELGGIDLDEDLVEEETGSHSIQLNADELGLKDQELQQDLSSVDVAGGEDEVLSEANVYLAYGLHDQAIDLLKPAVDSHPERNDYMAKLLEAYHATSDRDAFAQGAEQLHRNLKETDTTLWQRVVVMGKDLIPDHDLFKNADPGDLTIGSIRKDRSDLEKLVGEMPDVEDGQETVSIDDSEIQDVLDQTGASEEFELPELDELNRSVETAADDSISLPEADKSQEIRLEDLGDLKDELSESSSSVLSGAKDAAEGLADKAKAAGAAVAAAATGAAAKASQASEGIEEDLTFSEIEDEFTNISSGVDQIGTKLDLAKAYLDMGDDEGAREALEEVIAKGNDEQKSEAKKLMEQIG